MPHPVMLHLILLAIVAPLAIAEDSPEALPTRFEWVASPPLLAPADRPEDPCVSVKDPTIVQFDGQYHLFVTIRSQVRSHQIEYIRFKDFSETKEAHRQILKMHPGFFCAPQIFFYTPHKKWYLICQASSEDWEPKYRAAYSTTDDISKPDSWSPLKPLFGNPPEKAGLDFWIISDETHAYFFYTTLDGRMWRSRTVREQFPGGWEKPAVCLQADIFEASHTYKLKGLDQYLTVIEAQEGGRRYYKAYLADRLDGEWKPLADSRANPFASRLNVVQPGGKWTDSISHGELLRTGHDERLEVDPKRLRFLFQGVLDEEKGGKAYGAIPWRLGLLEQKQAGM